MVEETWGGEALGGYILGQGCWVYKQTLVEFSSWQRGKETQ